MLMIQESLIRYFLRYTIVKDLPGHLRIRFPSYRMLPKEALPYTHYVNDMMTLIPHILSCTPNPTIGTVLICYDAEFLTTQDVCRWIQVLLDEGIRYYQEHEKSIPDEKTIAADIRDRLINQVAQVKK